ncbi:MAG TPA: glycosyltransferase, partial [Burkholderiaceae bacterium]|nr:glycosyltransferase [Burkholderiaceae bacterium]
LLTLDKASGQPDAQGRYQLVAMGRLVPSKQFDVLIRAFAAVAHNFPNWNLSIWGEGPLHSSLQQQIQQSGLQQRIQLMGHSKQAFQQLQQATAFVLTSRVEGFPNVLLEAMALGLPCISFDCPSGPAELSADGQAALLVPLNNLARLQQALAEIMADANLRAQLSDRARRWVLAQYKLPLVLQQWQALLAEPQAVQASGTGLNDDASGVHKQTKPLHVVHIISGLGQGGAETALYRLSSTPSSEFRHTVISMSSAGEFSERFRQAGVPLYTLGMPWGRLTITGLWRLHRLLKSQQPDVVQTWMYYADLIGGVMARLAGIKAVSWGLRNSGQYLHLSSRVARLMAWCCARVSPWVPAQIVSCSEAAAVRHVQWGYSADKMRVIANGYDLDLWRPDAQSRQRVRRELGIDEHTPLIGTVSRWNPQKDHANLLQALTLVKTHWPQLRCALVGLGLEADNQALAEQITQFGLQENVLLLGQRSDVPALMNALDLHVLPSRAEAFPNVVAEAMACGVTCVATDVGDAAAIVASYGWLVPPQNPQALAQAIEQALDQLGSTALKQRVEGGRQHIQQTFSLSAMSAAYQRLWRKLTLAKPAASGPRLLMVVNNPAFFLSHRLSIALAAQKAGFDVHVATPYDRDVNTIRHYGLTHHTVQLTRSGMNPLVEGLGVWRLWRLFRRVRPDIVHAVTIKPVLYGGL